MNTKNHSLLLRGAGVTVVALAFAIAIGSADSPLLTRDHHDTHAGAPATHGHIAALHNEHEAMTVIHAYAAAHLGDVEVLDETFGGTPHWSPNWNLYWLDVRHQGHLVRIYHAIHKHQPGVQYTVMSDHDTGHVTDWEPIH